MQTVGLGHLLLKQLVDHSVANRRTLAFKLVAHNRQSKVRLNGVVGSPHGSMVGVFVRVIVDLEENWSKLVPHTGVDGVCDWRS